jgi:protocatechuate 3,4-dioxygenase beta subunit
MGESAHAKVETKSHAADRFRKLLESSMKDDDTPAGLLLTRRQALLLLGATLLSRSFGATAQGRPVCVARPQQMEGPFFVETGLNRSDIRSDPATGAMRPGLPLRVTFRVSQLDPGGCAPLPAAHVELWQCDAAGVYSGVNDGDGKAAGQRFLRGYQVTDAAGIAQFTTIYPGWYPGRTVHLHFTIRAGGSRGRRQEFTSQLYFADALTDKVHALAPYGSRGARRVRNAADGLYRNGGSQLTLAAREEGPGLVAAFDIGLQGS